METKEDVTDQSAIKDNDDEQKQVNVVPQTTLSSFPSSVASNIVQVSVCRPATENGVLRLKGLSKFIGDDTKVAQLKKVIENWFSMYYYYHMINHQKFVNEQDYFSSWFQSWHPLQISMNGQNAVISWCYVPQYENYKPEVLHSETSRESSSTQKELPWRCRSERRSFDHAFKFFQNYNLRGQKTLVFKKREAELNGKYDFRNDPKIKEQGYKYAQNLNNSISRRVTIPRSNCTRNRSGENPYYELCDSCTKSYKPSDVYTKPKRLPRSYMDGDDQKNDIKEPYCNSLLRKQTFKIEPGRSNCNEKSKTEANMRKHPVQLLCELYGKNGLQIECEFICSTPFRKQKVTYTVMGRKFTAISHTRDEAKRLCAKKVLMTLHPELQHELQEDIPKREYDFGYRLNRRHPVDLVNYFFKNEAVLIETEKKGLSHFTSYTVYYTVRGKKFVATAEKQNEAKRRCAILVLNDFYRSNDHYK